MEILNVLEPVREDESLTSYDYRSYYPYNASQLGNSDEIRIPCHNSTYTHLSESCLYIEGSLSDITPDTLTKIRLSKCFPLFLFSEARLELNGHVIDYVRSPGIVSCMKNYCLMTEQEKGSASEFFWSEPVEFAKTMTKFSCCIPLRQLFGICLDYKKVVIFSKLELVLLRSRNDLDCLAESIENAKASIKLSKVSWRIPHVDVNDMVKLQLNKILETGRELTMNFRAVEYFEHPNLGSSLQHTWQIKTSTGLERPLYVILGLQTDRKEQVNKDSSKFDHCNLRDAKLFLNSYQFPYESMDLDFSSDQFSSAYRLFTNFRSGFFNDGHSYITTSQFKSDCPLIIFDTSRMPVDVKSTTIDVRLELSFRENVPPKTCAHLLIFHDKMITYSPFSGLVLRQT